MKFIVFAVIMVVMAGIFHMLFIGFDYAFYNDDSGAFVLLKEASEGNMNEAARNSADNLTGMFRTAFGICRVICIALVPFAFVINTTSKTQEE